MKYRFCNEISFVIIFYFSISFSANTQIGSWSYVNNGTNYKAFGQSGSCSHGRHGTQAIVNNDNIWIASGSPNRGGGFVRSQERFTFTSLKNPILSQVVKSDLTADATVNVSVQILR